MQTANTVSETVEFARELLTEREAADYLGLRPGTLAVWRSTGRYGLGFIKVGAWVRYRRADLETWLKIRTRPDGSTK